MLAQGVENARQLAEIEDKIIEVLSGAEGNILENETAITVITASKTLSNDINHKQQIAQRTEKKVCLPYPVTAQGYSPMLAFKDVDDLILLHALSTRWALLLFHGSDS